MVRIVVPDYTHHIYDADGVTSDVTKLKSEAKTYFFGMDYMLCCTVLSTIVSKLPT